MLSVNTITTEEIEMFLFCFQILKGNRSKKQINSGYYVEINFDGITTRQSCQKFKK